MAMEWFTSLMYLATAWMLWHQPSIFIVRAHRGVVPRSLCVLIVLIGINVPCDFHEVLWNRAHESSYASALRLLIESRLSLVVASLVLVGGLAWWCAASCWSLRWWVRLGLGLAFASELGRAALLVAGDAPLASALLTGFELAGLTLAVGGGPWHHHARVLAA